MRRALGVRWRLTLWYGGVLAVILIASGGTVYALMRHHLMRLADSALGEELADFAGDVQRSMDRADFGRELALRYAFHEGYEFEALDAAGRVLFRSDRLFHGDLPVVGPAELGELAVLRVAELPGRGRWRVASRILRRPRGVLIVRAAIALAPVERALHSLMVVFLVASPLALVAGLGGGYWLSRKALAPVDRLTSLAQEITANRLDRWLEAANPHDELGRLVTTFNDMIFRLKRSFEEVKRFTADAAHELRTPLASMRTEAEVALRAPRDPDRDRRVIENLLEEVERLSRLIAQMLFLCREDSGSTGVVFEEVRLDRLVSETGEHMRVVAGEKGVELEVLVAGPCLVRGDAVQLRQLLFNLLDNAVKYTPAGGKVTVRGEQPNGRARITIADTGIGIPGEHLPHVFERFYRVDPARGGEIEGTGLGLAICRSIVELHHGEVCIESKPGEGTRVSLFLPIAGPTEAGLRERAAGSASGGG